MMFPAFNKKYLILKVHFFLYQAGFSPVATALPVYARTLGFSSFTVGLIFTIAPISILFFKPICGGIADRFRWHKQVMLVLEVICLASYFSIQFIPPGYYPIISSKILEKNATQRLEIRYMTNMPVIAMENDQNSNRTNCSMNCYEEKINNENDQDDYITFHQYQFYIFVILSLVGMCTTSVVATLSDTICIAKCEDTQDYGKQRLWGSLGFGIFSIISGFLVDAVSGKDSKNYSPVFYMSLLGFSLDVILSYFLLEVKIPEKSENLAKDTWKAFLNAKVIVFMIWCVGLGAGSGMSGVFLFWLLEDLAKEQGAGTVSSIKTIEGLANGVQTFFGEAPAFLFAGWIIRKIGHSRSTTLVLLTIGLQFILLSFLKNPWLVLLIEPLQLYYGIFHSTLTSYANHVAPPGTKATVQSIMAAMYAGIGVATGCFLGGVFYRKYKGPMSFRIAGIAFFGMAISNEIFEFFYQFLRSEKVSNSHSVNLTTVPSVVETPSPQKIT